MFYHLWPDLAEVFSVFNVFQYITFRAAGALVTSLGLAFLLGPMTIRVLQRSRSGQVVRSDINSQSAPGKILLRMYPARGNRLRSKKMWRVVVICGKACKYKLRSKLYSFINIQLVREIFKKDSE